MSTVVDAIIHLRLIDLLWIIFRIVKAQMTESSIKRLRAIDLGTCATFIMPRILTCSTLHCTYCTWLLCVHKLSEISKKIERTLH